MNGADQPLHVFLVAGEPSGDMLGARLMQGLRAEHGGDVRFSGVGGPEMAAQGLDSLFDYGDLAVMGLFEVLPRLPRILRRIRQTAAAIRAANPDVLVTIDAPGFVFAVLKRLGERRRPRVHYVAPQVWAWRPGRVHKYKRHVDHILTLFPFEPPYFDEVGLPATFVGHSVVEDSAPDGAGPAFRSAHNIPPDALVLCALPGSRAGEVSRLMPVIAAVVEGLAAKYTNLHIVLPTVDTVAPLVRDATADWRVPVTIVEGAPERLAGMAASDIALAASGTVTLELACAGVPALVIYKVTKLTGLIAERLLKVPYASPVNLLAGREVLPEFLQRDCVPGNVAAALQTLIDDPAKRADMIAAERDVARQLGEGAEPPSRRAAKAVLSVVADAKAG